MEYYQSHITLCMNLNNVMNGPRHAYNVEFALTAYNELASQARILTCFRMTLCEIHKLYLQDKWLMFDFDV